MSDIVERLRACAERKAMWSTGLANQAADTITRLTAEVEKLRSALQWQPIETAPRISRYEILVWDGEHRFVAWWKSGAFWRADGAMFDPTHWMHLPPPPALKENNDG